MNKLNVAIKLLQLLNERKIINSKMIADELNVSVRTAQRYLLELSVMPCVIMLNNHTYSLDPDYKISEPLLNATNSYNAGLQAHSNKISKTNQGICLICGQNRIISKNMPRINSGNFAIDKLVSIIKKKLEKKRCCFPKS